MGVDILEIKTERLEALVNFAKEKNFESLSFSYAMSFMFPTAWEKIQKDINDAYANGVKDGIELYKEEQK